MKEKMAKCPICGAEAIHLLLYGDLSMEGFCDVRHGGCGERFTRTKFIDAELVRNEPEIDLEDILLTVADELKEMPDVGEKESIVEKEPVVSDVPSEDELKAYMEKQRQIALEKDAMLRSLSDHPPNKEVIELAEPSPEAPSLEVKVEAPMQEEPSLAVEVEKPVQEKGEVSFEDPVEEKKNEELLYHKKYEDRIYKKFQDITSEFEPVSLEKLLEEERKQREKNEAQPKGMELFQTKEELEQKNVEFTKLVDDFKETPQIKGPTFEEIVDAVRRADRAFLEGIDKEIIDRAKHYVELEVDIERAKKGMPSLQKKEEKKADGLFGFMKKKEKE